VRRHHHDRDRPFAGDLWNAEKKAGLWELTRRLDDVNFRRVVEALTIGRGVRFGERLAERLAA
jgi:hypothetical protein